MGFVSFQDGSIYMEDIFEEVIKGFEDAQAYNDLLKKTEENDGGDEIKRNQSFEVIQKFDYEIE